ncbi:PREDICTED: BEN domain-containing protein 3 [Dipodomys ordii]|uniref:BEN domain-containing protein 3 n=1 Tax=Dipodomys ordii TaxID=10020 RepID=A0A1S3FNC6_DIPOR|nr:PREDICTED: BEN domain-containing protein 3 [Dipodomys ordii]
MNSTDFSEDVDEVLKNNIVKVETEAEDAALDCSLNSRISEKNPLDSVFIALHDSSKRRQLGSDGHPDAVPSVKRRRLIPEALLAGMQTRESSSPCQSNGEQAARSRSSAPAWPGEEEPCSDATAPSYKKPLYSISHKIMEKKNPPTADLLSTYELLEKANSSSSPSPLRLPSEAPKRDGGGSGAAADGEPNIYFLIQKMFYMLNTLTSNMSQLHSKVDLLSLEVSRIKKQVSPTELVAKFQPPPEYQLTAAELKQIVDQSLSGGDLACRLLVQLFPELFSDVDFSRGCSACGFATKRKLESLHLQLIRNYVEVYYPSVKDTAVWQAECLPQLNDFFSRFWAQREMEDSKPSGQVPNFFEVEQVDGGHFLDNKDQEEALSLDRSSTIASDHVVDTQDLTEFLDEVSSPGEFAVFLLHRLFPELFDHRKLGEQYSCYGEGGKQELDPQRLQIIRNYTEIYFPDMQEEEAWRQQCAQRLNDELEGLGLEAGSDGDAARDDCYDSFGLPDISVVKVEDSFEGERPGRRSKKIWLVPIDFDKLDIPQPDFEVPGADCLLSKEQLRSIYESSLSIGNFASRLLVHLFPELFTHENLRKQYNCSGSLGKKQLDPTRIKLIRHYVQLLYPRAKNDRVWTLEFVGKLDERCRRRDTEQRRSYQQQRKVHVPGPEGADLAGYPVKPEKFREEFEGPPLPPERSSKDFCKIPLEELVVPSPDFPVPSPYLLSDKEVREIVQQSLSVGNFAARLLVRLFPELFTAENLRLQYNHSGACNKKQLDPTRLRLIRHYVEAVYPVEKMEEVWHYECIPSIDERCRRPNRKKCDILKKAKKVEK